MLVEIPFVEACVASSVKKEMINYEIDWVVDLSHLHHTICDMNKFIKLYKYEGKEIVTTIDNTMYLVQHVGYLMVSPYIRGSKVLEDVYHVTGMKKNLVLVPPIIAARNYVVVRLDDVKVLTNLDIHGNILKEEKKAQKLYVSSVSVAYVDKANQHEKTDL